MNMISKYMVFAEMRITNYCCLPACLGKITTIKDVIQVKRQVEKRKKRKKYIYIYLRKINKYINKIIFDQKTYVCIILCSEMAV